MCVCVLCVCVCMYVWLIKSWKPLPWPFHRRRSQWIKNMFVGSRMVNIGRINCSIRLGTWHNCNGTLRFMMYSHVRPGENITAVAWDQTKPNKRTWCFQVQIKAKTNARTRVFTIFFFYWCAIKLTFHYTHHKDLLPACPGRDCGVSRRDLIVLWKRKNLIIAMWSEFAYPAN